MICSIRHAPYFLCLCSAERQPLLEPICAQSPYPVIFVEQIEEVMMHALRHPPLALLLELATSIRFGAERMSKFLNLGVNWPVMRCVAQPEGEPRIMCFEPPHGETLLAALEGIASGDPSWEHPRFKRRHLRLNLPGRVRLRVMGEERWRLGNLQGISCGGCFITMTTDTPAVDTPVELELVDFAPAATRVCGVIAWARSWEESLEIPGVGVEFDPATVDDGFRSYITRSPQIGDLISEM